MGDLGSVNKGITKVSPGSGETTQNSGSVPMGTFAPGPKAERVVIRTWRQSRTGLLTGAVALRQGSRGSTLSRPTPLALSSCQCFSLSQTQLKPKGKERVPEVSFWDGEQIWRPSNPTPFRHVTVHLKPKEQFSYRQTLSGVIHLDFKSLWMRNRYSAGLNAV